MRRWFVIVLLACLPLQFSWAAVVGYCAHVPGGHAQHAAHQPQPQPQTSHADVASGGGGHGDALSTAASASGIDLDCGHCHANCCALPAFAANLQVRVSVGHPPSLMAGSVRTRTQAPPDRPQWLHLA